jgi:cellobiose phosphorylase
MQSCDWNDGTNRVGREGCGASVWLAWFLSKMLGEFAQLARLVGDRERGLRIGGEAHRARRRPPHLRRRVVPPRLLRRRHLARLAP